MLLNVLYFNAWKERNRAASDVNTLLHALNEARKVSDEKQAFLERVAVEVRASGFEGAEDYLTRVWPEQKPPEQSWERNHAVVME